MKNPTLADAKRLLRKNNSDVENLSVAWVKRPRKVFNWQGKPCGIAGRVIVSADGFRTREMTIERFDGGIMIR